MKKISLLIALAIVVFTNQSHAQDTNVPKKVMKAFTQKFSNATDVEWEKENKSEWEAEFKVNGKEYSANFATDGTWKETEHEIKDSEIPALVKKSIVNNFPGYEIEEAEMAETPKGKVYEFELEKGKEELEVVINASGTVLKKEVQKENKQED